MDQEIWKVIKEYPNYKVSNLGKVKHYERLLRPNINRYGYETVLLYNNVGRRKYLVHRLVAFAFIPNTLNKPQINHINGIKTDNRVENLEWVTNSENMKHAFRTGIITKEMVATSRSKTKKHIVKMLNGEVVARYFGLQEAAEHEGRKKATISQYCLGDYKDSRGYEWRYEK